MSSSRAAAPVPGRYLHSGRIQPRLAPETFRTSRLLDFATRRELTAQIGHQPSMWPQVVVKELVDNALDAAEQAETRAAGRGDDHREHDRGAATTAPASRAT